MSDEMTSWNAAALEQLADDMQAAYNDLEQELDDLESRIMQAFGGDEKWKGAGRDAYEQRKQQWEQAQRGANLVLTKFQSTAQKVLERYGTGEHNIESMWA